MRINLKNFAALAMLFLYCTCAHTETNETARQPSSGASNAPAISGVIRNRTKIPMENLKVQIETKCYGRDRRVTDTYDVPCFYEHAAVVLGRDGKFSFDPKDLKYGSKYEKDHQWIDIFRQVSSVYLVIPGDRKVELMYEFNQPSWPGNSDRTILWHPRVPGGIDTEAMKMDQLNFTLFSVPALKIPIQVKEDNYFTYGQRKANGDIPEISDVRVIWGETGWRFTAGDNMVNCHPKSQLTEVKPMQLEMKIASTNCVAVTLKAEPELPKVAISIQRAMNARFGSGDVQSMTGDIEPCAVDGYKSGAYSMGFYCLSKKFLTDKKWTSDPLIDTGSKDDAYKVWPWNKVAGG